MRWLSHSVSLSISPEVIEKAFNLSYALHPERTGEIARQILPDAHDWALGLKRTQCRREPGEKTYKLKLSDDCLLQMGLFKVSEEWEQIKSLLPRLKNPDTLLAVMTYWFVILSSLHMFP
jgi:hypothetical protein